MKSAGNGVLSTVLVTGQEDCETLLGARWVRFAEDLDDFWVGEPFWDLATCAETVAELRAGNVESSDASWDFVLGAVLVAVWEVGHHLEGNDLDTKLILVFLNSVLSIVWAVELLALAVLSGSSVIATNDEVGCSKVLADNGVPDSLTGSTHAHGEGEETKDGHTIGVPWEERLVNTDTGEVIDVSWLCETNDWVDENVGLAGTGSSNGQFSVGSVHWVSGLESDNLRPAELVKVKTELCRGICANY